MPSISLDGLSTLKRDENFYLWLALRLAIERTRGQGESIYFRTYAVIRSVKNAQTAHSILDIGSILHALFAQCPIRVNVGQWGYN